LDNPAKRLLLILEEGKSSEINKGTDCLQVWKRILKVSGNNDAQLLSRLGKTIALVGEIEDELSLLDGVDSESCLAWVPLLKNAFAAQNLTGPWSGFIDKVDNHTLNYLKNCSALLDATFKQKYKSIENVSELSAEVQQLLLEVLDSDLPETVKIFMSSKLREIQRALDEYHVTGNGPIVKAVESYVGFVVINNQIMTSVKEDSTAQKFGKFMSGLAVFTTLAMAAIQLPDEVREYFPDDAVIELPKGVEDDDTDTGDENNRTLLT